MSRERNAPYPDNTLNRGRTDVPPQRVLKPEGAPAAANVATPGKTVNSAGGPDRCTPHRPLSQPEPPKSFPPTLVRGAHANHVIVRFAEAAERHPAVLFVGDRDSRPHELLDLVRYAVVAHGELELLRHRPR